MKLHSFAITAALCLIAHPVMAVTLNIPQQLAVGMEKQSWIERFAGFDAPRKGAVIQADLVFSQFCQKTASVADLDRISYSEGFEQLYQKMKAGRSVGLHEAISMLVKDKQTYCEGKK